MSINLEINKKQLSEQLTLHYLPAGIEGDGEANIDEYFNNYTTNNDGHLSNALRGYPIDGSEFQVPPKFTGVVLQEKNSTLGDSADRLFRITGTFNRFTYWNYDKVPSAADALRQAIQVSSVANELSKSISAEEVEKEMAKHSEIKLEHES